MNESERVHGFLFWTMYERSKLSVVPQHMG
jgi:hypothetical protein